MEAIILKYWAIILSLLAGLLWLARLEGRVEAMQKALQHAMETRDKELRSLWRQRNEDLSQSRIARDETNLMIHTLTEKVDGGFENLRKEILQIVRERK